MTPYDLNRFSINISHDGLYTFPWKADLCDSREGMWVVRARGQSVSAALDVLAGRMRNNLRWPRETIDAILATAVIQRDKDIVRAAAEELDDSGWKTFRNDNGYSEGMKDNDGLYNGDSGDEHESKSLRLQCEACGISAPKYSNGDATGISDRMNRFGLLKKLCHVCGLEEQVAILRAKKDGTSGEPKRDFDGWLTLGDAVRAHAAGVQLAGELPTVPEPDRATWAFDLARSLGTEAV